LCCEVFGIMLRKHQGELDTLTDRICSGQSNATKIFITATPGGGKSTVPIIAGKIIKAGLADGICWIVPRTALQDQGERSFLDPFFRDLFQHDLSIRTSTNDLNPMRDQNGFITTYQAIGIDNTNIVHAFKTRKMIIILDEFHHIEKDGVWHEALKPLMDLAAYQVLMTGTLERGDEKQIAFVDYQKVGPFWEPVLSGPGVELIEYTRTDALKEKAILPLKFHLMDGHVRWKDEQGIKQGSVSSFDGKDTGRALYAALDTDFAKDILNDCLSHWHDHNRGRSKKSKLLVVAADYEHAEELCFYLRDNKQMCQLATSHDSAVALKNIKAFKFDDLDILVTIAMAYEGLDVPAVSHIACLTNIRSTAWITQMIARAVRIWGEWGPYESQVGHIFAPDDKAMHETMELIQAEQLAMAKNSSDGIIEKEFEKEDYQAPEQGSKRSPIEALEGSATGKREVDLGSHVSSGSTPGPAQYIQTIKEQEKEIRDQIENHIRQYAFKNRYEVQKLNAEVKNAFNQKRSEMSLSQLKHALLYVRQNYPLVSQPGQDKGQVKCKPRGSGKRLPTKAIPSTGQQYTLF